MGMIDILNEQITRDIARRIAKTGHITATAEWQTRMGKQSGLLQTDVTKEIAKLTGFSKKEVMALFEDAGLTSMMNDSKDLIDAGIITAKDVVMSGQSRRLLEAAAEKCHGDIGNLTLTTATTTQEAYIQAMNEAYMQVTSGAFSYQEAVRQAVRNAAIQGTSVSYDSGYICDLDVAVRRALQTGVNQTVGKITEQYSSEMGAEYYETTAHAGARPSHAEWQGQVFKIEGSGGGYRNFYEATGYGTGEGLCGWNCRHSFYPFWPNVSKPAYTKERLKEYTKEKYEYNGKKLTEYDCTQIERSLERNIRERKRILAGYDSYINSTTSDGDAAFFKEEFSRESVKLKDKEKELKEFCKQTNRRVKTERTAVTAVMDADGNLVSFNRSVSSKAVWANKKSKNR